jgi:riboflavin kinase
MSVILVEGKVFSGSGEGAKFVALPWVKKQITKKLGFKPYPGTLNIKLTRDCKNLKNALKNAKPIEISPRKNFCRGICFKAFLMDNVKCAVVIPEIADYPEDVIEILAPINLREKFQLKDGDNVKVKILLS